MTLMGRLRPHQLVHPDLVTEGMNRLAQALLAVTASVSAPASPPPAKRAPPAVIEPRKQPQPEVLILVEKELVQVEEPIPPAEVPPPQTWVEVPGLTTPAAEAASRKIANRRAAYRELAGLRGLLRAWDKFRVTIADPSAVLNTPG